MFWGICLLFVPVATSVYHRCGCVLVVFPKSYPSNDEMCPLNPKTLNPKALKQKTKALNP